MKQRIAPIMLLALGVGVVCRAQTTVDLRTQVKNVDFSGAASTKPFKTGTSLPTHCSVGETFFQTNAPAGQNLLACTAVDTWTVVSGSGSTGLPQGTTGQVLTSTGSNSEWRSLGGDVAGQPNAVSVVRMQGRSISQTAPVDGSVLQWNSGASLWEPAPLQYSAGQGIVLGGTTISIEDAVVPLYYTGNVHPSLDCLPGRDTYLNTASGTAYFCKAVNQWQQVSNDGHMHDWTDIRGGPLGVLLGGTGSDLSSMGPGFLKQAVAGGPVSTVEIADTDLPSTVLKTSGSYANPAWLTSIDATKISGIVPLSGGGTGAATAAAAFDSLSPAAAKGDLIVHNGSGNIRLPAGADGNCLHTDSTKPGGLTWTACATSEDGGASLPAVFNLIAGDGYGNGADSGIAPANVPRLNGANTYTGTQNSTGATTLPDQVGTAANRPATCALGQTYFSSDGIPGRNLQFCTSPNTWMSVGYEQGTTPPATCSVGQIYFKTGAAAGQNLYYCTATNTWTPTSASEGGSSYYQTMTGAGAMGAGINSTDRTQRSKLQARDNLAWDDDGVKSILNFQPLDARTVWLDEEFMAASSGQGTIGNHGWTSSNIHGSNPLTANQSLSAWPNLGILRINAGNSAPGAGDGLTLMMGGSPASTLGALGSQANWGFMWIFALGSASDIRARFGVAGGALSVVDPVNSFGVRLDTNAGDTANYSFYVKGASGNDVTADSGIAADTGFHSLLVYSTAAGTIRMSLDGGAEKTFCASGCDGTVAVPTAGVTPFAQCVTDTTASKACDLDAFKFKARVATGTANKRN